MNKFGSYIARKIDGSYVSAYSEALGSKKRMHSTPPIALSLQKEMFSTEKQSKQKKKMVAQYSDAKAVASKQ